MSKKEKMVRGTILVVAGALTTALGVKAVYSEMDRFEKGVKKAEKAAEEVQQ